MGCCDEGSDLYGLRNRIEIMITQTIIKAFALIAVVGYGLSQIPRRKLVGIAFVFAATLSICFFVGTYIYGEIGLLAVACGLLVITVILFTYDKKRNPNQY